MTKEENEKRLARLKAIVSNMPTKPGSYQYYDEHGTIIYVGKAKNLKNRVSSYFHKEVDRFKTKVLVSKIHDLPIQWSTPRKMRYYWRTVLSRNTSRGTTFCSRTARRIPQSASRKHTCRAYSRRAPSTRNGARTTALTAISARCTPYLN